MALVQALQKKIEQAHKTLDNAQALLTPEYDLARARILLERGRVFQQAEKIPEAQDYFEQSYELSRKHNFDYHTINAAHMIAIVAEKTEDKIKWNQRALELATSTPDKRAHLWLGALYNNLGQNYLEAKQFDKALTSFQKALEHREREAYIPNIRAAKWALACALRSLDCLDDALAIQHALAKEYETMAEKESFDIPIEMFKLVRGMVYEEITEIYHAKTSDFAKLAYDDLSNDAMFKKTCSERLERLKQLQK